MRNRRLPTAAATVLALGLFGLSSGASAAPGQDNSTFFTLQGVSGSLVSETRLSSNSATAEWTASGLTVTVAGPIGSTVNVASSDGTSTASISTPGIDKQSGSVSSYVSSGQALIDNAIAVGYTPAQAAALAQSQGIDLQTQQPSGSPKAAGGAQGSSSGPIAYSLTNGEILASPCASVSSDGGAATGRGCDVQRLLQHKNQDWYVGDSQVATGYDSNWWYGLTGLRTRVGYGAGNSIVNWAPTSRIPRGQCSTNTLSLSYNGIGFSSSSQLCPDSESPAHNADWTKFGAEWSGCAIKSDVGENSVDYDHSPPGTSVYITEYITIWWGHPLSC